MANKKISELPYINGGKISGNTLVPLVTYFSAATGDTVHTYIDDFQTYLISGLTGNTDVFVTGGTYSAGTITFTNNTGGTFNVTGLTTGSTSIISGEYLPLSGGTVTGSTEFTAGLSANTISATTYLNLPITTDVFVTGGTYSNGDATFTNNTGGTFNVTGFYTGETSYVNSLTTGVGLSADTTTGDITIINTDPDQVVTLNNGTNINVTGTYPNFTIDVTGLTDFNTFTTGFTYSSNTFTISDNSGSTFDATFTEVTGLTVNGDLNITGTTYSNVISATTYQNLPDNVTGNYLPLSGGTVTGNTTITADLTVSGNSGINWFSSNTSSDLVRITQTGVGNAFVIEDNTNPDSTPFIINSGGSVSVGTTSVFSSGGAETKLNVSNGSSGVATTGLTTATPLVVESNLTSSIGMISPDNQVSQIYFGTPSDALGSVLRWDYTKRDFSLGTSTTSGKLIFLTGSYDEVARIDQSGNMGIGLTGATQKLEVSGNTRIYGSMRAQTGYISGSGQNILTVIGSGNSTTSPLFSVQGSSGELFSVTDSLTGSLFSVNDISGLPIMEVFSDNTTLWGSYQAPSLNTTTRTSLTAGTNTIYSIPTSAYTGAFFEYTLISSGATGARAGQIMSIWSGSTANFTETSTTDIGTTTGVTFTVTISGNNAVLSSSATTAGWTVKTIIRSV